MSEVELVPQFKVPTIFVVVRNMILSELSVTFDTEGEAKDARSWLFEIFDCGMVVVGVGVTVPEVVGVTVTVEPGGLRGTSCRGLVVVVGVLVGVGVVVIGAERSMESSPLCVSVAVAFKESGLSAIEYVFIEPFPWAPMVSRAISPFSAGST